MGPGLHKWTAHTCAPRAGPAPSPGAQSLVPAAISWFPCRYLPVLLNLSFAESFELFMMVAVKYKIKNTAALYICSLGYSQHLISGFSDSFV